MPAIPHAARLLSLPATALAALVVYSVVDGVPAVSAAPAPTATPTASPTATPDEKPEVSPNAPDTDGSITLSAVVDRDGVLAGSDGQIRVEVRAESHHTPTPGARVPTDLVVVLDKSGSMSGGKMDDARAATRELIAQLGEEDRFSLVTFDSSADLTIPLTAATSMRRTLWSGQLDLVLAGGSTNMHGGLDRGLNAVETTTGRAARVILISDGRPDSRAGLLELARSAAVGEMPLTTVGIGDDYDEALLSSLADAGTGNFHWVQDRTALAQTFADEFDTARETVASGLQVQMAATPGVRLVDAAGYPISHTGADSRFTVGSLYAGQSRQLWLTLEVDASAAGEIDLGDLALTWRDPSGQAAQTITALPEISVGADEQQFVAMVDEETWSRGVLTEAFSTLQMAVSRSVQAGDQAAADALIDDYQANIGELNRVVGSATVEQNLTDVEAMKSDVARQFQGRDQAAKQNVWAKGMNQRSYSGRRQGQSRSY